MCVRNLCEGNEENQAVGVMLGYAVICCGCALRCCALLCCVLLCCADSSHFVYLYFTSPSIMFKTNAGRSLPLDHDHLSLFLSLSLFVSLTDSVATTPVPLAMPCPPGGPYPAICPLSFVICHLPALVRVQHAAQGGAEGRAAGGAGHQCGGGPVQGEVFLQPDGPPSTSLWRSRSSSRRRRRRRGRGPRLNPVA